MADRLLLLADDVLDDVAALPDDLCQLVSESEHVHVVAPTTGSRLDTMTEDESIYEEAIQRANRVAELVREQGVEADADHSESAPLETALAAIRAREPDAVVVLTTGAGHWREEGLLDQLRGASEVPVHAVALD